MSENLLVRKIGLVALFATGAFAIASAPACSHPRGTGNGIGNGNGNGSGASDDNEAPDLAMVTSGGGGGGGGGGNTGPCTGLQCQQRLCGEVSSPTTISGTVYDPAGHNPLYNVVVFVPNSTPDAFPSGASCDSCSSLYTGNPVVVALTGADGRFSLTNAPDGNDIPLVIQIGKWRRQITIPTVKPCQDNALADKSLTLPKDHTQGDLPNIAISTGGADTLECLLTRVGVSKSEYVGGAGGSGHIHIFAGASPGASLGFGGFGGPPNTSPPAPSSSSALWDSKADLMRYDIVLLSCEGSETTDMNQQAMHDYASAGGRVFGSHYHYAWFNTGPYGNENLATWDPNGDDLSDINGTIETKLPNGQPFPKGVILSQWLGNVGALQGGELPIQDAKNNAKVTASNVHSQAWIYDSQLMSSTQYFSFNTPTNAADTDAGVPNYCGRVVYSDLHVGAASNDYMSGSSLSQIVPSGCASSDNLSAQEDALEFMLFDLSSCVVPDGTPPVPPIQ